MTLDRIPYESAVNLGRPPPRIETNVDGGSRRGRPFKPDGPYVYVPSCLADHDWVYGELL